MLTLTRETGSVPDETREPFDRRLSDLFDRIRDELLRREMNRWSFLGPDDLGAVPAAGEARADGPASPLGAAGPAAAGADR